MSESQKSSRSIWIWVGGVAAVIVVIGLVLAANFTGEETRSPEAEVLMTPRAGAVAIPTATPDTAAETESDATDEAVTEAETGTLAVGMQVEAVSPSGKGVPLRADAGRNAMVMDTFDEGAKFIILEPSGDYDDYPVESDGSDWYRVRAEDGLVGWVEASSVLAAG